MQKTVGSLFFAAAIGLSGCASSPTGGGTAATSERPAAQDASGVAAVTLPATAARRVVLTMTGPKNVVESADWPELKREWRETFADHAKAAGIAYSFADAPPPAGGQDGTLLQVNVTDFRVVGVGARVMLGIMTGNAFIDANVRYVSLRTGATYGEQRYNTSSSAWSGVFAKVTPQQVDAIANNVFVSLKAAR